MGRSYEKVDERAWASTPGHPALAARPIHKATLARVGAAVIELARPSQFFYKRKSGETGTLELEAGRLIVLVDTDRRALKVIEAYARLPDDMVATIKPGTFVRIAKEAGSSG